MSTTSELRPATELRRHLIEDLSRIGGTGMSERTQEMYVRAVPAPLP